MKQLFLYFLLFNSFLSAAFSHADSILCRNSSECEDLVFHSAEVQNYIHLGVRVMLIQDFKRTFGDSLDEGTQGIYEKVEVSPGLPGKGEVWFIQTGSVHPDGQLKGIEQQVKVIRPENLTLTEVPYRELIMIKTSSDPVDDFAGSLSLIPDSTIELLMKETKLDSHTRKNYYYVKKMVDQIKNTHHCPHSIAEIKVLEEITKRLFEKKNHLKVDWRPLHISKSHPDQHSPFFCGYNSGMNFWRDGRLGINSNEILFETDEENKSWFNQLKFDPRRPGIFTSYYNSHGYPSWREREGVPLSFSSGKGRITTSTFVSDDLFFQLGEKLYLKVGFNDSFSDPDFFAWELVFADPDQINEAELDPIYW